MNDEISLEFGQCRVSGRERVKDREQDKHVDVVNSKRNSTVG